MATHNFRTVREARFAKRMQDRLQALGLKQMDLAKQMGVPPPLVNNWYLGYCKPRHDHMELLASALKCNPIWLQYGNTSEIEERLKSVMRMQRIIVRELEQINKALHQTTYIDKGERDDGPDKLATDRDCTTRRASHSRASQYLAGNGKRFFGRV